DVPTHFLGKMFDVMSKTPRHTYQILSKRAARMEDWCMTGAGLKHRPWPLPNCWLGVSVENQATANERIPPLVRTRAAVHFLSCEPLLSFVDLTPWLADIQWVIVG